MRLGSSLSYLNRESCFWRESPILTPLTQVRFKAITELTSTRQVLDRRNSLQLGVRCVRYERRRWRLVSHKPNNHYVPLFQMARVAFIKTLKTPLAVACSWAAIYNYIPLILLKQQGSTHLNRTMVGYAGTISGGLTQLCNRQLRKLIIVTIVSPQMLVWPSVLK